MKHIVYVGGKSGGHIIPALTLAAQEHVAGNRVSFIALDRALDRGLCQRESYLSATCFLSLRPVMPCHVWKYPAYGIDLVRAVYQCVRFLRSCAATHMVSMGGYLSVPAVIAARMLKIPISMYELNAEPGVAVQWLARSVDCVYYCFPAVRVHFPAEIVSQHASYPIRYQSHARMSAEQARERCDIAQARVVLFVLGGSQGSQFLNQLMIDWLRQRSLPERKELYVIHQTGEDSCTYVKESYEQLGVDACVFAFHDNLAPYYCASDCIITRAGAGALHEIIFFQRPAIIIPLEVSSTVHQLANAHAVVAAYPDRYRVFRQHEHQQLMHAFTQVLAKE